ncbi:hypothetical protein L6164_022939 [Bauhinia variegata]|uniref:Uncharacterized protein n=1 Tax=Bauhinia variegata TaxID=167791 RepID=A0ACB9MHB4_BAUVA|nr:hypothetical protein L6164_022939 [Bauhinia variegata]
MASLTPGVLSKLLENAGNKDVKVTGEHRSALLQVIEIVPCFAGGDDPWQSRGYFLKVSDSVHSAYVSVADEDLDLIYSDKIQLGQFVYVTRLDSASPVPLLRGLKPVPKRRACVGSPTDLVSSELLPIGAGLDFKKPKKGNKSSSLKINEGIKVKAKEKKFVMAEEKMKSKEKKLVMGEEKMKPKRASPLRNNGKVRKEGLEIRRMSLDSSRRVWDQSSSSNSGSGTPSSRFKVKSSSYSLSSAPVVDKKALRKNDSPLRSPRVIISPLKNKNENSSPKLTSPPLAKSVKSSCGGTVPSKLVKLPFNFKTWSDQRISWDNLSHNIGNLGKQVVCHRNVSFLAAVRALEEVAALDSVVQCTCLFAELSQSSQTVSAGLLVKRFLELHLNLQRAAMMFDSLITQTPEAKPSSQSSPECLLEDISEACTNKNAVSWIQAAVGTNLAKFNLFKTKEKSEILNGENCHFVVIETAHEEKSTENHSTQTKQNSAIRPSHLANSTIKRVPSSKRLQLADKNKVNDKEDQSKESGLKEAGSLAEKLLVVSREWFLKYLEDALENGFGLRSEEGSPEIACLLGQLKKVNNWLDNLVGGGDEVDHRIENLRKRLYRFLLEHVNSAIVSSK